MQANTCMSSSASACAPRVLPFDGRFRLGGSPAVRSGNVAAALSARYGCVEAAARNGLRLGRKFAMHRVSATRADGPSRPAPCCPVRRAKGSRGTDCRDIEVPRPRQHSQLMGRLRFRVTLRAATPRALPRPLHPQVLRDPALTSQPRAACSAARGATSAQPPAHD